MPQLEYFCKKQNFQPSFAFNLFCEKKHRIDKQPVAIIGGIAFIAPVVCRVKSVIHTTANPRDVSNNTDFWLDSPVKLRK